MKKFYKVCSIIALCLIGVGFLLLMIEVIFGASFPSLNVNPFHYYNKVTENEGNHSYDFNDNDSNNNKNNFNGNNNSSDILEESYNNVKSLDLNVKYGEISIQRGDKFTIEGKNSYLKYIKSYVEDGTWVIEDTRSGIHGISMRANHNSWIRIYIPKDFNGEEINISLGAGEINIEELSGDTVILDVGAGKINADKLTANEEADFNVGAGKIEINSIHASNADFECGMGEIIVNGVLIGDSEVECGMGQITLNLDGKEEDYNYYIDSDVGSVIINDKKYNFNSKTKKINKNGKGDFVIECGVGNVTIKTN